MFVPTALLGLPEMTRVLSRLQPRSGWGGTCRPSALLNVPHTEDPMETLEGLCVTGGHWPYSAVVYSVPFSECGEMCFIYLGDIPGSLAHCGGAGCAGVAGRCDGLWWAIMCLESLRDRLLHMQVATYPSHCPIRTSHVGGLQGVDGFVNPSPLS